MELYLKYKALKEKALDTRIKADKQGISELEKTVLHNRFVVMNRQIVKMKIELGFIKE